MRSGLSKKFYETMMKFCFPERDSDNMDADGSEDSESSSSSTSNSNKKKGSNSNEKSKKTKETNFYVPMVMKDDVEKMKVISRSIC